MARSKRSTEDKAPRGKRQRKLQLKKCRAARQTELQASTNLQQVKSATIERTLQNHATSAVGDDFLGDLTRSQFKTNAYASMTAPQEGTDDSSCSTRGIIDFVTLNNIVGKLCCPDCKNPTLSFQQDTKTSLGLAMYGGVFCSTCHSTVQGTEGYLAEKDVGHKDYTVNRQSVYASLVCGLGAQQLNKFCESMDLPGMHHKTFHQKAEKLYAKLPEFEDRVSSETVRHIRQVYANHFGITLSDDDVLDICVSFDGSWLTRGHTSHIGIGCVVDLLTGLCIDSYVVCNYCQVCETTGKKLLQEKPLEYAAWAVKHLPTCDKNFGGKCMSGM